MSELLLPAGSVEKMKYAFEYGADACYLGFSDFSLRALRKGELIDENNLKTAVEIAHKAGKKLYCTFNIFAYDDDIKKLDEKIEIIKEASPDAVIVSDFGILRTFQKKLPGLEIHISTQTNILNSEAVKFWRDFGARRVVLARELTYRQMEEIRNRVPDIELEIFVHGAQCMAYSGRCLLSDYLTEGKRRANLGNCAQACRWSYKITEETRPDESYELVEDERGSHIMSTKDLCLIKHLKTLENLGIDSFKIEGRTKSLYYVSAVAKTYRKVLDDVWDANFGFLELKKAGNRGYTEGFFLGDNNSSSYSYDISKGLAGADFLGVFLERVSENSFKILIKNKILLNDEIEIMTPDFAVIARVKKIIYPKTGEVDTAKTNDEVVIEFDCADWKWTEEADFALIRTTGIKE